jgi:hypothetical protein
LFSRVFNHVGRDGTEWHDSSADFLRPEPAARFRVNAGSDVNQGSIPMTFVSRLSVLTAYLAFAFVGAIVLGVI